MNNTDPFLNKLPPHNLDAEESILSAMMLDNSCLEDVFSIIKAEDFYKNAHQTIFSAMHDLFSDKKPVDLVTVAEKIKKSGTLEEVGGALYLAQIVDTVPMAVNVLHYSNIIKEKAISRSLIHKCNDITERCFSDNESPHEILDFATAEMSSISNSTFNENSIKNNTDTANEILDDIEACRNNKGFIGLSTGITRLDNAITGLQPATFIILAARPSMGKTSLALTIAKNVSNQDKTTFLVSYETNAKGLGSRIISSLSGINSKKFKDGSVSDSEWDTLNTAADQYSRMKIKIDESGKDHVSGIRRKALKIKKESGLDLIIIDHISRMPKPKADRHDLALAEITSDLNHLSNELNIPVILLSQLNRELEKRDNKRPRLSDLKNSGSIEEDADIVMFLYRDIVYNQNEPLPYDEIIIPKNRDGEVGMVKTKFLPETTQFVDYNDYPKDWNKKNGTH